MQAYSRIMLGPRLFRSRWTALLWAGGILWTAYDVASAAPTEATPNVTDAAGAPIDQAELAAIVNTIEP